MACWMSWNVPLKERLKFDFEWEKQNRYIMCSHGLDLVDIYVYVSLPIGIWFETLYIMQIAQFDEYLRNLYWEIVLSSLNSYTSIKNLSEISEHKISVQIVFYYSINWVFLIFKKKIFFVFIKYTKNSKQIWYLPLEGNIAVAGSGVSIRQKVKQKW